ncbi:50S ribosomal protein L23 [Blattabacterium cuenoti]|uniref:50S ribosomal protein L23 n=1 Tax=Blattabacterium cuenoti TaxID=1653831 RepID=UPI00163BF611|nr:50S ribosomal protein L23 [Blattabacterium cuenoti]
MIFVKPSITEKSSKRIKDNYYTFYVRINCNKIQIKKEIKKVFGCSAKNVRTMIYPRKDKSKYTKKGFIYGKTIRVKKAIVQINENQKIDFFNQK